MRLTCLWITAPSSLLRDHERIFTASDSYDAPKTWFPNLQVWADLSPKATLRQDSQPKQPRQNSGVGPWHSISRSHCSASQPTASNKAAMCQDNSNRSRTLLAVGPFCAIQLSWHDWHDAASNSLFGLGFVTPAPK